jgi:hypothetical protein
MQDAGIDSLFEDARSALRDVKHARAKVLALLTEHPAWKTGVDGVGETVAKYRVGDAYRHLGEAIGPLEKAIQVHDARPTAW